MSTTPIQKTGSRRRRSAEEVRKAALVEARALLLSSGPDAVTLKAVADRLEMTHSNLLHHFGSAAELQSALMGRAMRMNAVVVFVALLFWGMVWGGWGLLLAFPIMASIKIVCSEIERLQPIALLMSS